ncbi:hypothetical protein ACQKGO_26595 [Corallococcus interemptor]|uniref:hypothetical protein n=1 Tax=Corallococcus interemptor TaxID=2316720 RepID=UPI003CFEFD22
MMRRPRCLSLGVAGCFSFVLGSVPAWADPAPGPQAYIGGTTVGEQKAVSRWLTETYAILGSESFHNNLKSLASSHPRIWLSSWERYRSPAQLSKILKLQDPDKPKAWWVPTAVALIGAPDKDATWESGYKGNADAYTGWTGYVEDGKPVSAMRIGRVHYDRYVNGNEVEKSCAINTLAHEISHTLSHAPSQYLEYFLDTGGTGPEKPGEPYASYLLGTLAQCTYLQGKGRIKAEELPACLAVFGVDQFKSNSCNDYPDGTPLRQAPPPPRVQTATPSL